MITHHIYQHIPSVIDIVLFVVALMIAITPYALSCVKDEVKQEEPKWYMEDDL